MIIELLEQAQIVCISPNKNYFHVVLEFCNIFNIIKILEVSVLQNLTVCEYIFQLFSSPRVVNH